MSYIGKTTIGDLPEWSKYDVIFNTCLWLSARPYLSVHINTINTVDIFMEQTPPATKFSVIRDKLIEGALYINLGMWFGLVIMFLLFMVIAFINPKLFTDYAAGIGFFGIALAILALFYWVADKIQARETDKNRDKNLEYIKNVCEKWDNQKEERFNYIYKICEQWDKERN
jgi:Na+-transporting methylmalonyl-CoA/oxaloacetate decarboxylase gamma subunit